MAAGDTQSKLCFISRCICHTGTQLAGKQPIFHPALAKQDKAPEELMRAPLCCDSLNGIMPLRALLWHALSCCVYP